MNARISKILISKYIFKEILKYGKILTSISVKIGKLLHFFGKSLKRVICFSVFLNDIEFIKLT